VSVHRPARPLANVALQDTPAAVAWLGRCLTEPLALKTDRCIIRHSLVSYSRRGRGRTGGGLQSRRRFVFIHRPAGRVHCNASAGKSRGRQPEPAAPRPEAEAAGVVTKPANDERHRTGGSGSAGVLFRP
jgi:hypothetical protein